MYSMPPRRGTLLPLWRTPERSLYFPTWGCQVSVHLLWWPPLRGTLSPLWMTQERSLFLPGDFCFLFLFYDGRYWKGLYNFCHYLFSLISVPRQMMPSTFYHSVTPVRQKGHYIWPYLRMFGFCASPMMPSMTGKDPRELTVLLYLRMSGFCASSMMPSTERDSSTSVRDPREVYILPYLTILGLT
jgi:hypothetical protein